MRKFVFLYENICEVWQRYSAYVKLLSKPTIRTVMNTLDIYIKKGRKEGLEQGKQEIIKNLIADLGLSDKEVARIARLSEAFV